MLEELRKKTREDRQRQSVERQAAREAVEKAAREAVEKAAREAVEKERQRVADEARERQRVADEARERRKKRNEGKRRRKKQRRSSGYVGLDAEERGHELQVRVTEADSGALIGVETRMELSFPMHDDLGIKTLRLVTPPGQQACLQIPKRFFPKLSGVFANLIVMAEGFMPEGLRMTISFENLVSYTGIFMRRISSSTAGKLP